MPNLVKFISTLLQKFHQKSCNLLEQGEATPPKISSRKNHQRPNSFCRTPCRHYCCSKFRNSVFSVVLVRQFQSRGHSALGTFLAASSSCPKLHTRAWSLLASVARWLALAGVFCGVGTSRGGRQEAHHGRTPFRAAHRSLALRVASCTPAHPRCTVAVARQPWTRSLPPTDPRRPVPTKAYPKLLIQLD